MTESRLVAALHLSAALPALGLLAPHDADLRRAAAGNRNFAISLSARGVPASCRLAFAADGAVSAITNAPPRVGDLRLWFPSAGQFLRATSQKSAVALPLGGWTSLGQLGRFQAAGARLDILLRDASVAPALFAYGNLAVGLAGACAWLRHSPSAASHRTALGNGILTFACPALPAPLWIDLGALVSGVGPAPRAAIAELTFTDLHTLLAELDHSLDALAALGGGELRIRGHLLIAERLSLVLNEVSRLLNPPAP